MNVSQVFELLMGWATSNLNYRDKVVPFDEMYGAEKSHQTNIFRGFKTAWQGLGLQP